MAPPICLFPHADSNIDKETHKVVNQNQFICVYPLLEFIAERTGLAYIWLGSVTE